MVHPENICLSMIGMRKIAEQFFEIFKVRKGTHTSGCGLFNYKMWKKFKTFLN